MKKVTCWICGKEGEGYGDGNCEGRCGRPTCEEHIVGHECFMVCSVCTLQEAVEALDSVRTPEARAEVKDLAKRLQDKLDPSRWSEAGGL